MSSQLELGVQVSSTTDCLFSCYLIIVLIIVHLSTMKAELAEVIAIRGYINFNYPQGALELGITLTRLCEYNRMER